MPPVELKSAPGGLTIGRHEACQIRVPFEAENVSRYHARLSMSGGRWTISDLNSRWGTFVNGVKLTPMREMPLGEGDLVRIVPYTFNFSSNGVPRRGLLSQDDTATSQTLVRSVAPESSQIVASDMLGLLLESAAKIHAAQNTQELADAVIDAACRGTGLPNAALLRPLDAAGRIEVIAFRQDARTRAEGGSASFSRSLLSAASQGVVAELSGDSGVNISESMMQMKIDTAICAPLMLGTTVAAYLYLDSRGGAAGRSLRANASGFCQALGRMAGLALANLKRMDIERRQASIEAELSAAAAAQKWIMPRRITKHANFTCLGESRPGQYVGGDFFDVIPLDARRVAVALGDVSGKGVSASVLMTASQGFLHAALTEHREPGKAVTALSKFIMPRRPDSRYLTLWVGVFDAGARQLTYVDAGHGHALMSHADGSFDTLNLGDGVPIGFLEDGVYKSVVAPLRPGSRALVMSDGIIEQFEPAPQPGKERQQFEMDGVKRVMAATPPGGDVIAAIMKTLIQWAGTEALSDDATMVLTSW
jgi:serine phosphatase RsbU (regulator of sigma subunit)